MGVDSEELDSWRIFFRTASTSIFDVINNAIKVAAQDCPLDLKLRRDQIVCLLYNQCSPCNHLDQSMPLEKKNVERAKADTRCRVCSKKGDGNERMDSEERIDMNDICVNDKSFSIQRNSETIIADRAIEVDGNEHDRIQSVPYQQQSESLVPAKNAALQHNVGSKVSDSYGISSGTHGILQEGQNKDTAKGSHCVDRVSNLNQMDGSMYEVNGKHEEVEVARDEDRSRRVDHQVPTGPLILAKSDALEPNGHLDVSGSYGATNGKHGGSQEELNENAAKCSPCVDRVSNVSPMGSSGNEVHGKDEELEADKNEERCQTDGHQDGIELGVLAKSTALEHNGDSKILGSCGAVEGLSKNTAKGSDCADQVLNTSQMNGSTYEQTEAWEDLVSEGGEMVKEISRIKEVLDDSENQSDMVLMELLKKLQRMDMNKDILQVTMIGKTVASLRKHRVKEIRKIVCPLISDWQKRVHKWCEDEAAVTDSDAEVGTPALDDRPDLPISEAAPALQSSSDELIQMFEGVNQKEFFSMCPSPSHSFNDSFYFPEELEHSLESQPPVIELQERNCTSERQRSGDVLVNQNNTFQLPKPHSTADNSHLPVDKNELVNNSNSRSPSPVLKQKDVEQAQAKVNASSRDAENKRALTKQRALSPLTSHNSTKQKQSACEERRRTEESSRTQLGARGEERRRREESSRAQLGASEERRRREESSHTQVGARTPPMGKNNSKYGRKSWEPNSSRQPPPHRQTHQDKLEDTKRKLREGYRKAEEEKKRRSIQIVGSHHYKGSENHKRHKTHHASRR